MKIDCLDIGMIQALLDGEISHGETARASAHIAICDDCSLMFAEAEEESAIVFPALEREFNSLVPTQRLWNKINDSITAERESRPLWQKIWAFVAVALANPSIAAAASLLIVVGIFSAVLMNRTVDPVPLSPTASSVKPAQSSTNFAALPVATNRDETTATDSGIQPMIKAERAVYKPETQRTAAATMTNATTISTGYMPGEESYVKTISSLNKTVEEQKDGILRPSERIAYERDMAVVNDTIAKMRTEVKRNPRNESAKQVLYSSYQNKIDLLNSVARKEELVASLR